MVFSIVTGVIRHIDFVVGFFFFFGFKILFSVYGCFTCISVSACSAHRGQKRAPEHLELELQMLVGHCVGPGN